MVQNGQPLGQMMIKLGLDTSAFSDTLTGATRAVKTSVKEMQAGFKIADAGGKSISGLTSKQQALTKVIDAQKKELTYLKKAYDDTHDAQGNATSTTAKAAQKYNEALGKLAGYEAQLKQTTAQLARMQVETQGLTGWLNQHADGWVTAGQKISKFGDGIQHMGSMATKALTVPLATGFTIATKKAADFNTQIGEIGPLLSNGGAITEEFKQQLDQMASSSKNWSKEYGVATSDINNGLAEIVRKGYDANQTMGVMPSILDATKASGEGFNDVMNVTTQVISQFELKGKTYAETVENASRVTDSLTYVANATSAGFTDLGQAMSYVGPVANSLGMDVELTASAIGLLTDAGIEGSQAGTALRGALTRLLKPSEQNIQGFEQLGISVEDFKNGTLTIPDMLDKIKANTEGWTDAQKSAAIALAFGTESQSAMNVLVSQGGDALRDLTEKTYGASGATKQIAQSMNNLPANKVARFKESLNVLAITFGEKLLPIVTPWIDKATDMVNKFSELDDATQQNILKWGAMAAAAGPALKLIGSGVSIFGKTTTGLGRLSKGIVELTAKAAEKKALDGFSTGLLTVGSSAATASGATGVGAMVSSLGVLGPALLGVAGIVGVGGVLYGAYKLFGEELVNSSRRTKEWGTDVGEVTGKALTDIKTLTTDASGQFSLMEQGFSTNSGAMVDNFSKIGESIESNLIKKIEGLDQLIKQIPESANASMNEMLEQEKTEAQKALEIVQENNEKITQIRKNASNNNREISISEAQMIKDLARETTQAYVETLDVSAEEKKQILAAMNADVANASKEQASMWVKSLAEQRQAAAANLQANKEDQQKMLKDMGYNLEGEFAQKYMKAWEEINQTTVDGFDQQIATIVDKYPELANEIHLATGQMINGTDGAAQAMIASNKKILDNANLMSNSIAKNAEKNAQQLKMTADESKEYGELWNNLAFDDKTGVVKTNAREVVIEATKDSATWNTLRLAVHDANLDSNAKKIIGEAAIANGWWDGMSFEDKKAILEDEFSVTMLEALRSGGEWDTMSLEDKTAFIYSNSPEVMADTMLSLGLWDKYQPEIKDLKAENYEFLNIVSQSEEKLNSWSQVPAEAKELLADNQDVLLKIYGSEETLNRWNNLNSDQKTLLANNTDVLQKVLSSEEKYNNWIKLPEQSKQLTVDNNNANANLDMSQGKIDNINNTQMLPKILTGNNLDLNSKADTSQNKVNTLNNTVMLPKIMTGNNSSVVSTTTTAQGVVTNYNNLKVLPKHLNASTNAGVAAGAIAGMNSQWDITQSKESSKTFTVTTVFQQVGQAVGNAFNAIFNEKGTAYHPGGHMVVNDQKGMLYKELVEFPNGLAFIPEGRNVFIPNAPKGTKVFKASDTRKIFPHYSNGVGVPRNSKVIKMMESLNSNSKVVISNNTENLERLMTQMLNIISRLSPTINIYPEWHNDGDIRSTSDQLAWLTAIDRRGRMK